ncbi:MAG: ATP--guanido phosphotransferase [Clostridium sp.]|nr:ATP--guanido phosphotransferase [Clostridium sp.]
MSRWFEEVKNENSSIVASRIRLARNWEEYRFPGSLTPEEAREMISRLKKELRGLPDQEGKDCEYLDLERMPDLERRALRERRLINRSMAEKKTPGGLILSDDERISLMLNGDDHIRIQVMEQGLSLKECYEKADCLDNYINERIPYAFNEKYGYLTTYPTNVGTGLKASVIVHLPTLSLSKKFQDLLGDMGRFGAVVRGLHGRPGENGGDLYEVTNQKTLGLSEKEILELVENVAVQLTDQEAQVRKMALEKQRLMIEDEVYKAYGVLRYGRRLAVKDAQTFLSHVRAGVSDGLIRFKEPCSLYGLMVKIQNANLQKNSSRPLGKEELEMARAACIRAYLPEIE